MQAPLIRLVPGQPFVFSGDIYYKEFKDATPRGQPLIRCFRVNKGIIDFHRVHFFDPDIIVEVYQFRQVKPDYAEI